MPLCCDFYWPGAFTCRSACDHRLQVRQTIMNEAAFVVPESCGGVSLISWSVMLTGARV